MMFQSQLYDGSYTSMNVEKSFNDVRKYLSDEFARIHNQHEAMKEVPSPWPSPEVLEKLVRNSSGYFIGPISETILRGSHGLIWGK
jgi:hypothetical protein